MDRQRIGTGGLTRLVQIDIDDTGLPVPTAEIEQERRVAIFDLIEDNSFVLPGHAGPLHLSLAIRERRLVFGLTTPDGAAVAEFPMSMGPFRQVVKDYSRICESYFDAVKRLPAAQIEIIDTARRGIHTEGARILRERLDGKATVDSDTARRLFTLICVLHSGI